MFARKKPGICRDVGSLGLQIEEVEYYIGLLEQVVLPPAGTQKKDVDLIFGLPVRVDYRTDSEGTTVLVYRLEGCPSSIYVSYKGKSVKHSHVVYSCQLRGLPILREDDPGYRRLRKEIDSGMRKSLVEIATTFKKNREKLIIASWNEVLANDKSAIAELDKVAEKIMRSTSIAPSTKKPTRKPSGRRSGFGRTENQAGRLE